MSTNESYSVGKNKFAKIPKILNRMMIFYQDFVVSRLNYMTFTSALQFDWMNWNPMTRQVVMAKG